MPSMFSQAQLSEHLTVVLGEKLQDKELESCLAAMEIVEPPVVKQFWQATEAKVGIYLVLAGKVRLLDSADNLQLFSGK